MYSQRLVTRRIDTLPPSPDTYTTDKDKPFPVLDFIVALAEVACGWIEVR